MGMGIEFDLVSERLAQADALASLRSLRSPLSDAPSGSICPQHSVALHSGSPRRTSQLRACYAAVVHTLCNHHSHIAPNPEAAQTGAASSRPPTSKFIPSRSSTVAVHTHRSLRFCLRLAPVYVHISPSAIVEAAIGATRSLARIRSGASVPLFDPTAHRRNACSH